MGITVTDIVNAVQAQNKSQSCWFRVGGDTAVANQQFTYSVLAARPLVVPSNSKT